MEHRLDTPEVSAVGRGWAPERPSAGSTRDQRAPATAGRRRVRVAPLSALPEREGRVVVVGDDTIALFRCDAGLRAVSNSCPHAGGPLADGMVIGDTVTCPLHGRVVKLLTGAVTNCQEHVLVYSVEIEDGYVVMDRDASGRPARAPSE
jgi:nitrite reductase (NADH) small subunit